MLLITIVIAIIVGALIFAIQNRSTPEQKSEESLAISKAKELYNQKKKEGVDFQNGPCLGLILENWVADVAHSPRQDIDNDPQNQCADFIEGRASHFVELDPQGNLIRAQ